MANSSRIHTRYLWIPILLYGVPNLLAIAGTRWLDILIVDLVPLPLTAPDSTIYLVVLSILFSFAFLVICIRLGNRFFRIDLHIEVPTVVGRTVFVLQLITLAAVLNNDYGRAGTQLERVDLLSLVASYLKSDFFFILYYGHVRRERFPAVNLSLYLLSNTVRGWTGMWLILLLIEVYYLLERKRGKATIVKLLAVTLVGLLIFPFVHFLRENIRGDQVESISYLGSYFVLVNRLQHATNVLLIAQEARDLSSDYSSEKINPWFVNGALGARVAGIRNDSDTLSKFITINYLTGLNELDQFSDDSYWYTNVGIGGWLFIIPWYQIPLFLSYLCALIVLPYWLVGRFLGESSLIPVLHVAAFVYVLHGWLEVQLTFVICVAFYVAAVRMLRGPAAARHTVAPHTA